MPQQARVTVRATTITPTDASAPILLVVTAIIDCPHCGHVEFQFLGHHLTVLIGALEEIRVANPGLVGEQTGAVVSRSGWGGAPPADPSMN